MKDTRVLEQMVNEQRQTEWTIDALLRATQDNAFVEFRRKGLLAKVGKTSVEIVFSKRFARPVRDIVADRPIQGRAFKNSADEVFEDGSG